MDCRSLNILGTKYDIKRLSADEYPKLEGLSASGLAELYSKELIIDKNMKPKDGTGYANFDAYEKKVLRHEIIHAFFHESGASEYTHDEVLVDWLAIQIQKIYHAMSVAGCLD